MPKSYKPLAKRILIVSLFTIFMTTNIIYGNNCSGGGGGGSGGGSAGGGAADSSGPSSSTAGGPAPTYEITHLSVANTYACAVNSDKIQCWGVNDYTGGIGTGEERSQPGRFSRPVLQPSYVRYYSGNSASADTSILTGEIKDLSTDGFTTCAIIRRTGTNYDSVYCWGLRTASLYTAAYGSLNVINDNSPQTVSAAVPLITSPSALCSRTHCTEGLTKVVLSLRPTGDVASAPQHQTVCVLNRQNAIFCWGSNTFGELGRGTRSTEDYTTQDYATRTISGFNGDSNPALTAIASGTGSFCIINDGKLRCWGESDYYRIMGNSMDNSSYPLVSPRPQAIRNIADSIPIASASIQYSQSCFGSQNGRVFCVGYGAQNADDTFCVRDPENIHCAVPRQNQYPGYRSDRGHGPTDAYEVFDHGFSSSAPVYVAGTYDAVCALSEGGVKCFGSAAALGTGTTDFRYDSRGWSIPNGLDRNVTKLASNKSIIGIVRPQYSAFCAAQNDVLSCWGAQPGTTGIYGNGTSTVSGSSPVTVNLLRD